jgi:aminobenzoyl-glutamate utilization protein B
MIKYELHQEGGQATYTVLRILTLLKLMRYKTTLDTSLSMQDQESFFIESKFFKVAINRKGEVIYMKNVNKNSIKTYLRKSSKYFHDISKFIYDHPETRFEEYTSSDFLIEKCEEQGFLVEKGIAGIPTAFRAQYGTGKPVIAFLGEYDALPNLSQSANKSTYSPLENDTGHGCGHNLLGTGSFAAACAVKEYLIENEIPGTVMFFGCPGEEGGSGKTFMVREGVFEGIDCALTWHPSPSNSIMSSPTLANYQVEFKYKGVASHAANSPHLGRSALDAVELMNVGANYLREHVIQDARLHYAVTNTGGLSPNVVQPGASVMYLIRAPQINVVDEIYQRLCKIAEGAALMTETELSIKFNKGCSNYTPNRRLEKLLYQNFLEVGITSPSEEEKQFAREIWETFQNDEKNFYVEMLKGFGYQGDGSEFEGKYLSDSISPYNGTSEMFFASTDVGDVSWVVPTAQLSVATSALGTALHTWQMTTQGLSTFANKGMLSVANIMTLTAIELFQSDEKLESIRDEFKRFKKANKYISPIPPNIGPSKLNGDKLSMI